MKIAIAQVNTTTGDVEGNLRKVRGGIARARDAGADLAVFPELTLSGWMPGDLLRERQLIAASESALEEMADASRDVALLVGHAARGEQGRFISAACLFVNGECAGLFAGPALHSRDAWTFPGSAGCSSSVGTGRLGGETIGVLVGDPAPVHVERSALDDARVLIAICALPFHKGCAAERSHLWRGLARKLELPLVLVNLVGGNGTLVFDGGSIVLDARGGVAAAAAMFKEDLLVVDLDDMHAEDEQEASGETARLYEALTLGLADFVRKSGFSEVVVALSGGVDSAVTSSLAVDALGPERVTALGMPSAYSTDATRESARTIAENLGIRYHVMPIEEIRRAIEGELEPLFGGAEADLAKQNVQARIRGLLLMAYANTFGAMPLATGNRSEGAVGYCTLYGDTAGGLAPIGDVPKTEVYELAAYINRGGEVIPRGTIEQPPSAELKPGQTDQDDLPPYAVLDKILGLYLDERLDPVEIAEEGLDEELVAEVIARVKWAGFKRRQSPPALQVFSKGNVWPDLPLVSNLGETEEQA